MIDKYELAQKAARICRNIKEVTTVNDALLDSADIPVIPNPSQSSLLETALSSDFNSRQELDAKKVMAAALLMSRNKGLLPEGIPDNIGALKSASIADDAILRMKIAYQASVGKIDISEGADILIDKATSRTLAVADMVVDHVVDLTFDKLTTAIAIAYPPAIPIAIAIKFAQPYITEKTQKLVRSGINRLNTYAKKAVRKVQEFVKSKAAKKIKNLLFGI